MKVKLIALLVFLGLFITACAKPYTLLPHTPIVASKTVAKQIGRSWVTAIDNRQDRLVSCVYGERNNDTLYITRLVNTAESCSVTDSTLLGFIIYTSYTNDKDAAILKPYVENLTATFLMTKTHLYFIGIVYNADDNMLPKMWGSYALFRVAPVTRSYLHLSSYPVYP